MPMREDIKVMGKWFLMKLPFPLPFPFFVLKWDGKPKYQISVVGIIHFVSPRLLSHTHFNFQLPYRRFFKLRGTTRTKTRLRNSKKKEIQGHTGNVSLVTKKEEDEFLKSCPKCIFQ